MFWLIVLLGYLLGAIPTAYIAGRLLGGGDIRQFGNGNMGAANAFRNFGAKTGLAVFFVDVGKGALAILIAQASGIPQAVVLITGFAVVIGHNWSVFLGFKGGRGFSTTIGVLLALIPQPMLILAIPTLAALFIKRNTTIAACVLFAPLSLVCWWLGVPGVLIAYSIALPCLIGVTALIKNRQLAHASRAGNTW